MAMIYKLSRRRCDEIPLGIFFQSLLNNHRNNLYIISKINRVQIQSVFHLCTGNMHLGETFVTLWVLVVVINSRQSGCVGWV